MSLATAPIGPIACHIRAEYLESPGLRLTATQIQRLWCLDSVQCEAVISALVDARFLRRTRDGEFVRID